MKVAAYTRVSTMEQDAVLQQFDLVEWAERSGVGHDHISRDRLRHEADPAHLET